MAENADTSGRTAPSRSPSKVEEIEQKFDLMMDALVSLDHSIIEAENNVVEFTPKTNNRRPN